MEIYSTAKLKDTNLQIKALLAECACHVCQNVWDYLASWHVSYTTCKLRLGNKLKILTSSSGLAQKQLKSKRVLRVVVPLLLGTDVFSHFHFWTQFSEWSKMFLHYNIIITLAVVYIRPGVLCDLQGFSWIPAKFLFSSHFQS